MCCELFIWLIYDVCGYWGLHLETCLEARLQLLAPRLAYPLNDKRRGLHLCENTWRLKIFMPDVMIRSSNLSHSSILKIDVLTSQENEQAIFRWSQVMVGGEERLYGLAFDWSFVEFFNNSGDHLNGWVLVLFFEIHRKFMIEFGHIFLVIVRYLS